MFIFLVIFFLVVHFQGFSISLNELILSLHIGKKCELQTLCNMCISDVWFATYNWASGSNQFLGLAVENGFVSCWTLLVFYSLDEAATTSMGKKL